MSLGTPVAVASNSVEASGGTIEVLDSNTPLDGLVIDVPEGAYSQATTFSISYQPIVAHTLPDHVEPIAPLIEVANGGGVAGDFIAVTLPVDIPDGYVGLGYYYDEATGELEVLPTLAHSATSLTVMTRHFSKISAAKIPIAVLNTLDIDTGFTPGIDDWQFQNRGSYTSPQGNCSGMCISAMWYYVTERSAGEPPLWGQFQNYDLDDGDTPNFWQDDDSAFRLVSTVQSKLRPANNMFDKVLDKFTWSNESLSLSTPSGEFYQIAAAFYLTKNQQTGKAKPVYLSISSAEGARHAIICYAIKNGTLYVADPNYPGDATRTITYTPGEGLDDGTFATYYSMPDGLFYEMFKQLYAYEKIAYSGYTSVFHATSMDTYWTDMKSGIIGDDIFELYDLEVEELDGQGTVVTSDRLDLTTDNVVGYNWINVNIILTAMQGRVTVYDYDEVKSATSAGLVDDINPSEINPSPSGPLPRLDLAVFNIVLGPGRVAFNKKAEHVVALIQLDLC